MSIPFVFGWGKKHKELGYLGIHRCSVCNSFAHFTINEVADKIKIYFIPIAKYNTKRFLVCGRCNNGLQLNAEAVNSLIADSLKSFTPEKTHEMWKEISEAIKNSDNSQETFDGYLAQITQKYGESNYVYEHVHRLVDYYFDGKESES